jgi:hypothetical protein
VRIQPARELAHRVSTPLQRTFPLNSSYHSQKNSRHFADHYVLAAHNGIVIKTTSSANVRIAQQTSNIPPLNRTARDLYS